MLDATTIAAGLLHDCVEDVDGVTQETIVENFGQDVALLVDGVTKLTRQNFSSREEAQLETLRKMFLAMAKDIRVVLIKLADRLHNMRTLKAQRPERQVPIAQETLDIYAPLAHRLGVYAVKWELEDLALRYIDPEAFYELVRLVGMKRDERERLVAEVTQELKSQLFSEGIRRCEIDGRPKHFYSIYRKMKTQHKTFDQIYDLIAVRVLVNTQAECYHVLGTVNNMWQPIPGRIKDYISQPKQNMYQSLHTTVIHQGMGMPFEVQIRTFEMHRIAEYGIAAHWRYKEGKASDELDKKLSWLRRVLDWQIDARDPSDFGKMLKIDLFADEVLVFTPKGDVVTLPQGRHAAGLRLPHPLRRRQPLHRRQDQPPHRSPEHAAQDGRLRRDHDLVVLPRSLARLAEHRQDRRGQGEDSRLAQARGARREHRSRSRDA